MIGLDTNILVRYITQDDPVQSPLARKLIESLSEDDPGFISHIVLIETVWVMESRYRANRAEIADMLDALLAARELRIERPDIALAAKRAFHASNADFADCLIARGNQAAGCDYTATFDAQAAKVEGMRMVG